MIGLMIDIETASTAPNARVLQIGWAYADLLTGETWAPPRNIWVTAHMHGATDPETVQWWAQQDAAIRNDVWNYSGKNPVHTPDEAFTVLKGVYASLGDGATVWGSPAMFDLPILTSMWANKKPWPYFQERDLMTLYKMLDPDKQLKPANPAEHDAASDAHAQLQHLLAIFKHNPVLQGAK